MVESVIKYEESPPPCSEEELEVAVARGAGVAVDVLGALLEAAVESLCCWAAAAAGSLASALILVAVEEADAEPVAADLLSLKSESRSPPKYGLPNSSPGFRPALAVAVGPDADGPALLPAMLLLPPALGESVKLKSSFPPGRDPKGSSPRLWTPVGVPTLKGRLPPLGDEPSGVELPPHMPSEPRSSEKSLLEKSKPKESMATDDSNIPAQERRCTPNALPRKQECCVAPDIAPPAKATIQKKSAIN